MKKIRQLTTELTFRCNAKCPVCHRHRISKINLNDVKYTYTLESFKELFYPKLLQNLEWLIFNGNFGDSIMNKQFREIISYVKQHGTRLLIHTNGGIHDTNYWTDVGNILQKNDIINFDLDGLEDTHSRYRINTKYESVLENAKTVIATKRPQVHWKYIVFNYNQHQVEIAKQLAIDLGFHSFSTVKTNRDFEAPKQGKFAHTKNKIDIKELKREIICSWANWGKWYISPEGLVFRCCWTGGHYYDSDNSRFYYPPNFTKKFNGFYVPIEKIISYNYWNKLNKYLDSYERSFPICKSQCGKLLSSREKIEENLTTGNKTIFDAYDQRGN